MINVQQDNKHSFNSFKSLINPTIKTVQAVQN
jgi:hypothetical protein